ncbi:MULTISPECIES: restriction endonuclease subunit S [Enterobacteriaceae]|uniref:restriction endonuclease subunit S n=1 Tax=Enterobacteriaceae TaxID=543 RepID=UPI00132F8DCF|nr:MULTISPECIES: restriction endonuclease subunit S [Enterobacteriaceae]MCG9390023.1 restriction endonuclease subunit S [Escherichia coli]MCG9410615.1 restriction endonuclease subunit S [Escherichia coli]MCK2829971.1 restriction endonuclease subunit S [Escherichia coli]MDQ8135011.1 restriction endonuclease subunit S [Escherichia coli]MDS0895828.1 restriction endonuclease subunit S [Escherichia coli]
MGSKWETVRLGDLTKWSSGGTPNKSEDSYWNGTIPWISASSMEGHLYSDSKLKITEDGLINGSRLAPANSILLLVRGSILHQKIQVGLATKAVAFNQDVKCLIVNNDMIDPWYLLLWFKAKEQDLLKIVESTGIGAGKLDTKLLMDYPVEIPPKEIKEYIRFFGKAIFDKTTLNENINYNLEKMSQTLFKSWFVDFDPVIDNALDAGNPIPEALQARAELRQKVRNSADFKPLPAEIRSLFPSEFEETELGWVPKGWNISLAGEEFIVKGGSTPSTANEDFWINGTIHWTSPKDLTGNQSKVLLDTAKKITPLGLTKISSGLLPVNTVLMSSRAPIGYLAISKVPMAINQGYIAIPSAKHLSPEYTIYWLDNIMDDIKGMAGGTTFAEISKSAFKTIKLLIPSSDIITEFSRITRNHFDMVVQNTKEIDSLTNLRDTLLPKLISGELSLEDLPDLSTDTEAA